MEAAFLVKELGEDEAREYVIWDLLRAARDLRAVARGISQPLTEEEINFIVSEIHNLLEVT